MTDHVKAPRLTLDNGDPSLRDESVRAFIDAENAKAATLFAQIADSDDEREQLHRYSDTLLVVYRAAYIATKAMLEARSVQVTALRELNDKAQRSLSTAHRDLAASRTELQQQRSARAKPDDAAQSPVIINLGPRSKRVEHDDAGKIVRIVEEADEQSTRLRWENNQWVPA